MLSRFLNSHQSFDTRSLILVDFDVTYFDIDNLIKIGNPRQLDLYSHFQSPFRSQRSVIMLKRLFKYPNVTLYKESEIVTVRGLFLLGVTVRVHRAMISSATMINSLKEGSLN